MKAQEELEKIYDYVTESIILESKATFYEEGIKPFKYFLSPEKSNKIKSSLLKLKWSEQSNEVTTDPKCIMAELRKFYSDLRSLNLPKL